MLNYEDLLMESSDDSVDFDSFIELFSVADDAHIGDDDDNKILAAFGYLDN